MQVVLITSDSRILLEKKLEEIINNQTNIVKYNYLESSLSDILEEASYVSLFDEMKYLIVKNADFFGKSKLNEKEEAFFLQYLENPYPCTTLILTTYEATDKRKNITKKMLEKNAVIELKAPKNYDLVMEAKQMTQRYQIGEQSIKYLVDACLGNYDLVYNEIQKLSLYFKKDDAITLEAMKQIVATNINDNVFKFSDAVIQKDLGTSIHLLEEFFSLKIDALQLMNILIREYRLMYYYKIMEKKRIGHKEMASSLKLQDWQINKVMKNASKYHKDDLKDYLLLLAEMDFKIKSGQYDKNVAMYHFLVHVMEFT